MSAASVSRLSGTTIPAMPRPLFAAHPRLEARLAHVSLADVPTPVQRCAALSDALGVEVWAKRDDRTAPADLDLYGGNKVRKLEFLLGQAIRRGSRTTVTVGYAGSNHALCTAVWAARLGMTPHSVLTRQEPAPGTTAKLLAQVGQGARLHLVDGRRGRDQAVRRVLMQAALEDRRPPAAIAAGGSSPLGTLGYVDAGFELAEQIRAGELPQPSRVYVPAGSMGTAAGLLLGLRAAGVPSPVHAVRVIGDDSVNPKLLYRLLAFTLASLRRNDPSFPHVAYDAAGLWLRDDQYGPGYGVPTSASRHAAEMAADLEGLTLDGTYSAKALAALAADAAAGLLEGPVLLWCTYDPRPLDALAHGAGLSDLPLMMRRYVEGLASSAAAPA